MRSARRSSRNRGLRGKISLTRWLSLLAWSWSRFCHPWHLHPQQSAQHPSLPASPAGINCPNYPPGLKTWMSSSWPMRPKHHSSPARPSRPRHPNLWPSHGKAQQIHRPKPRGNSSRPSSPHQAITVTSPLQSVLSRSLQSAASAATSGGNCNPRAESSHPWQPAPPCLLLPPRRLQLPSSRRNHPPPSRQRRLSPNLA